MCPLYFKISNSANDLPNDIIQTLLVGTAENRVPKIIECVGLPDLIDSNGKIIDELTEKSDFEKEKDIILNNIKKIYNNKIIKYISIDPAYTSNKRNPEDDPNYLGHISSLLIDIPDNYTFDKN